MDAKALIANLAEKIHAELHPKGCALMCEACVERLYPVCWEDEIPTATGRVVAIQTRILCDVSRVRT
jgi:hypothetical protein